MVNNIKNLHPSIQLALIIVGTLLAVFLFRITISALTKPPNIRTDSAPIKSLVASRKTRNNSDHHNQEHLKQKKSPSHKTENPKGNIKEGSPEHLAAQNNRIMKEAFDVSFYPEKKNSLSLTIEEAEQIQASGNIIQ